MDGEGLDPAHLYAKGCVPDAVLLLRDCKGNTVCRLTAVKAILAAWSPVLRNAVELASCEGAGGPSSPRGGGGGALGMLHHSSSSGCLAAFGSHAAHAGACASSSAAAAAAEPCDGGPKGCGGGGAHAPCGSGPLLELPVLVDSLKEVEAWKVALCLMHPLDPTCGKSPTSIITTCIIKQLVTLADKYNLQGLLPHCKDMLLDPRSSFGVPGIHDQFRLDALEWIQIAEGVPGFEAVVVRCITQIVASTTTSRGRSQRMAGGLDQPRYRGHEALVSAMSCLRPETCAKLASSMASCLAVACENMANQDRYSIRPVGDHWWGWEYQYEPLRK